MAEHVSLVPSPRPAGRPLCALDRDTELSLCVSQCRQPRALGTPPPSVPRVQPQPCPGHGARSRRSPRFPGLLTPQGCPASREQPRGRDGCPVNARCMRAQERARNVQPARPGDPPGALPERLRASSAPLAGRHPSHDAAARERVLRLGDGDRDTCGSWEDTARRGGRGDGDGRGGRAWGTGTGSPPPPPCAAVSRVSHPAPCTPGSEPAGRFWACSSRHFVDGTGVCVRACVRCVCRTLLPSVPGCATRLHRRRRRAQKARGSGRESEEGGGLGRTSLLCRGASLCSCVVSVRASGNGGNGGNGGVAPGETPAPGGRPVPVLRGP